MNFSTSLQKRFLSAVVMAAASLAMIYVGGVPFIVFVILCGAVAFYEWSKLSFKLQNSFLYLVLGVLYITASMWCCYLIRTQYGIAVSFLFVVMIWASDSGAYFVGKIFKGPKMAKYISPNKTWSGYLGALLFPAIIAVIYSLATKLGGMQPAFIGWVFVIGALMGVTGQAGDLIISWLKRGAKVKDTGDIIPGHGGILDRIDALLLCAPVFLYSIGLLVKAHY